MCGLREGLAERAIGPEPHIGRYQYWTCADMSALDTALPTRPRPGPDDLRSAAHELYLHFKKMDNRS